MKGELVERDVQRAAWCGAWDEQRGMELGKKTAGKKNKGVEMHDWEAGQGLRDPSKTFSFQPLCHR